MAKGKQHQRTVDRIHIAVRLEIGNPGMLLGDIATRIGLSQTSFSLLRKTQAYKRIKDVYLKGFLSQLDDSVSNTYELGRQYLEISVPVAMQNLLDLAMNAKHEQTKLKASIELLNRQGQHPAISRTSIAVSTQPVSTEEDNEMAAALIAATANDPNNSPIPFNTPNINTPPLTGTKQ